MNDVETFNPDSLGPALFPYSNGATAGGLTFTAGQVALDADNNVVAPGDAKAQTVCALDRVRAVLAEKGGGLESIVSTTVYIPSLEYLAPMNEGWVEAFGNHKPARATVVAGLLIEGLVVEITAIAATPAA